MSRERWQQVEHVYNAVISRPEREWQSAVAELCASDGWLRHEVESLLAHEGAAGAFLETPALVEAGAVAVPTTSLVGRRFGSYSVVALLGTGGMGEVYRAHDLRLGRDVAIKILPRLFSGQSPRRARFENEAQMLAALNHPHIGAIYGVEDVDDSPALVLELVEGETLAERIARRTGSAGPGLPVHEALSVARQIALALEAAHGRGIIHRDLKPANVKITPDGVVKVLDFGLAKLGVGEAEATGTGSGPRLAHAPAIAMHGSREGMILGTLAYMSPEQAAGKVADKRSDLWAFGVVLLEMLTGRPVFIGETESEVLTAVLKAEPDLSMLPIDTPLPIRRLLRRSLEKDRTRRLDSALGARLEIDDALVAPVGEGPARAPAPSRRVAAVATAGLASAAAMALLAWIAVRSAPEVHLAHSVSSLQLPAGRSVFVSAEHRDFALSPDGEHICYRSGITTFGPLMVRSLKNPDPRPLPGSNRAYGAPFFSPDSQWIGFFQDKGLKKVSLKGGPVLPLAALKGEPRGASWGVDNTIVFATDDPGTGLWRVSAEPGGEPPEPLTWPIAARQEIDHLFPTMLPDGRGVLFTITSAGGAGNAQVAVLDLKTGERRTLVPGATQAEYVGTSNSGYLIYAAAGTLRAIGFNPVQLDVFGEAATVVEDVMTMPSGAVDYAVSRGKLVYLPSTAGERPRRRLVWVDRMGGEKQINAPLKDYGHPRLSPDEKRVAVDIFEDSGRSRHIWILELATGTLRRLTSSSGRELLPSWTSDGRVVFASNRTGEMNLYWEAVDRGGIGDQLTTSPIRQYPTSTWLDKIGNRQHVVGWREGRNGVTALMRFHWTNPLSQTGNGVNRVSEEPVDASHAGTERWADISRDGRHVAYVSERQKPGRGDETLHTIMVKTFPQLGGGWSIADDGRYPAWGENELFYLDGSDALIAVRVRTDGSAISEDSRTTLFDTRYARSTPGRNYDVSNDAQRFLMIKDVGEAGSANMILEENWFEAVKERVR